MNFILENRKTSLIFALFISACFIYGFENYGAIDDIFVIKDENNKLKSNIQLFISSIPIIFLLWTFRTFDTREAIEKSQENINMSLLAQGMDMITDDSFKKVRLGLIILSKLKRDNKNNSHLIESIDSFTYFIDLSKIEDKGIGLRKANLSGINLHGANLSGANLGGADLSEAHLSEAHLSEAHLSEANLSEANLNGVNLSGVDLSGVDLSRANLSGVDLSGAHLSFSNLSGADLYKVRVDEDNAKYLKEKYPDASNNLIIV